MKIDVLLTAWTKGWLDQFFLSFVKSPGFAYVNDAHGCCHDDSCRDAHSLIWLMSASLQLINQMRS